MVSWKSLVFIAPAGSLFQACVVPFCTVHTIKAYDHKRVTASSPTRTPLPPLLPPLHHGMSITVMRRLLNINARQVSVEVLQL